jgi:hypothetical protein
MSKENNKMKTLYLILMIFIVCGILTYGDNNEREEVDFLLFMPNSSDRFVNEEQAFTQLNKLAHYFLNKNLNPGQIIVYGYAAYAPNDIRSDDLSKERALTVINELQRRGVSKELFADPVGYGSVYQWGNNANENDKKPNRRVRILLDGDSPMPITQKVIDAETGAPKIAAVKPVLEKKVAPRNIPEYIPKRTKVKFPWWVLPVFTLFLFLLLIIKARKPAGKEESANTVSRFTQIDIAPAFVPEAKSDSDVESAPESPSEFIPNEAMTTWTVNLDEEIRLRAYELSQQRGEKGDYRDQDWYDAVYEISSWYTACGHSVYSDGGYWWATRSYNW